MKKLIPGRPSPSMIVAVVAVVLALGGTAVAAGQLSLHALTTGAKKKTVGVGKLTYVTAQQTYNVNTGSEPYTLTATCPTGTHPLGGGTKLLSPSFGNSNFFLTQDYPSTTGFTSQFFAGSNGQADVVQVLAVCGVSQAVTGSPLSP
jgi:hypothetical protein